MKMTNSLLNKLQIEKIGVIALLLIIFLLSFPRSWSIYPLWLFLICGLLLWLSDFKKTARAFLDIWYLIIPPVLYFMVHFISVILQKAEITLLVNRLMFILIPLLGFPVFINDFFKQHVEFAFKTLILGLLCISVFLLIRISWICINGATDELSLIEYIRVNSDNLVSLGFSVLEHPTYLSMKLNSALLFLICFSGKWKIKVLPGGLLFLLFSIMIFMSASKTGIFLWALLIILFILKIGKEKSYRSVIYIVLIPSFVVLSFLMARQIDRIEWFLHYTKAGIVTEDIDLKNIDQRTREWYSALQLIKEKPLIGFGLAKVEDRMVKEYHRQGFEEEAALMLNAHNQYLEAQMTFGIAGILSLLIMLLTPVFFHKRLEFPGLTVLLIIMIIIYLFFESMFNRQWGIMFFMLYYCILTFISRDFHKTTSPETLS